MAKDLNRANALTALLDSSTITEAAEKAGISRRTMYTYIHDDLEFARAYQTAREKLYMDSIDEIQEARKRANAVIYEIMEDKEQSATIRLQAAKSVISDSEEKEARVDALVSKSIESKENPLDFSIF